MYIEIDWNNSFTCFSAITKNETEVKMSKRSLPEEGTLNIIDGMVEQLVGEDKCRLEVWRCVSGVMEGGVKFLDKPGGLLR